MVGITLIKAHAFGNDFLLLDEATLPGVVDRPSLARRACDRHRGVGADGLIFFRVTSAGAIGTDPARAAMALLNADGSYSEISGNGVRCLAAWVVHQAGAAVGARIQVDTDAGAKLLDLVARDADGLTFRAAMGHPEDVTPARLEV